RTEFEYAIPYSDAEEMMRTMCEGNVLDKVRHFVSHEGNNWHVDVYEGLLDGVVLAEIELADAGQEFAFPDWIGAGARAGRAGPRGATDAGAIREGVHQAQQARN